MNVLYLICVRNFHFACISIMVYTFRVIEVQLYDLYGPVTQEIHEIVRVFRVWRYGFLWRKSILKGPTILMDLYLLFELGPQWFSEITGTTTKILPKDSMVGLKIISLYVYKNLRLRILGLTSHVTIITGMAT